MSAIIKTSRRKNLHRFCRLIYMAGLLVLALSGYGRASLAISARGLLEQAGFQPGPFFLIASGLAWSLLGLVGAGLLLVRRVWASRAVLGISLALAASYWADRLLLTRSASAQANWPFALAATLALLAFSAAWYVLQTREEPPHDRQQ